MSDSDTGTGDIAERTTEQKLAALAQRETVSERTRELAEAHLEILQREGSS